MPDVAVRRSDIALVFGTRDGVSEFAQTAYLLWRAGFFSRIILSGGVTGGQKESEASVLNEKLINLGLPSGIILLEERATNTMENVLFSRQVVEGHFNIASVLAIGKISSTRRYLMTLRRHWPSVSRSMFPINYFKVEKDKWFHDTEFRDRVLKEHQKIPRYIEHGFIEEI